MHGAQGEGTYYRVLVQGNRCSLSTVPYGFRTPEASQREMACAQFQCIIWITTGSSWCSFLLTALGRACQETLELSEDSTTS